METKIHKNNLVSYYDWTELVYREKIDPRTIPQNHLNCLNIKDNVKIQKAIFALWNATKQQTKEKQDEKRS